MPTVLPDPDIVANVVESDGPDIVPAQFSGLCERAVIGGRRTWKLSPLSLLRSEDPARLASQFSQWRTSWHRSWRLDSQDSISFLARYAQAHDPAWALLRDGAEIDPAVCARMLESLPRVRSLVSELEFSSVVLSSPERPGALRSWRPGSSAVLAVDGGVEIALERDGIWITCARHGQDPVREWGWNPGEAPGVWVSCGGHGERLAVSDELYDQLDALAPGRLDVRVLVRPWSVSVARTLAGMEEALPASVRTVRHLSLTAAR